MWNSVLFKFSCIFLLGAILLSIIVNSGRPREEEDIYLEVEESVSIKIDPPKEEEIVLSTDEVHLIAKTLYGECRGISSDMEKAAVVWCILNRVDSEISYFDDTIEGVVTAKYQFSGYDEDNPLDPYLVELTKDVMTRWYQEKSGETEVGRVLPKEYLYFTGDGTRNWFTSEYQGKDYWDWSLPNVYE